MNAPKLTEAQVRLLARAVKSDDGARCKGSVVGAARALERRGLGRYLDVPVFPVGTGRGRFIANAAGRAALAAHEAGR